MSEVMGCPLPGTAMARGLAWALRSGRPVLSQCCLDPGRWAALSVCSGLTWRRLGASSGSTSVNGAHDSPCILGRLRVTRDAAAKCGRGLGAHGLCAVRTLVPRVPAAQLPPGQAPGQSAGVVHGPLASLLSLEGWAAVWTRHRPGSPWLVEAGNFRKRRPWRPERLLGVSGCELTLLSWPPAAGSSGSRVTSPQPRCPVPLDQRSRALPVPGHEVGHDAGCRRRPRYVGEVCSLQCLPSRSGQSVWAASLPAAQR